MNMNMNMQGKKHSSPILLRASQQTSQQDISTIYCAKKEDC